MTVLTAPPQGVPTASLPYAGPSWIVRRRWPIGVSLAMTVLCLLQAPGRIIADTKVDLALDPVGFLQRATHLWDAQQSFGQIQNQAPGYLFPMGPFFAIGHLLHVPPWIVQRLWISLLLVVALWGVLRVAEALRIGTPASRLLGATVYALSPAMLSVIGIASGGQLPSVFVPWALLPLVRHRDDDSPVRTAALSGVAIACMGGVNAISTAAVLPIPLLWILTRPRREERRPLLGWWLLAVAVATFWWTVPLLLQARYGYSFLHFTENARLTTSTSSLFETTRGTGYWLSYLRLGVPWLRGGWTLVAEVPVILASAGLAAAGIYGLARRGLKERRFLVVTALVGVVVVTAGYSGPLSAPLGGGVRSLLDGPLSPLRNLNKFEALIRLPLALGLAAAVVSISIASVRRAATGVLVVLVMITAAPMWQGSIAPDGTFAHLPGYWTNAARWLDRRAGPGSTLVVPSAAFGEYSWGRPLDEPMQALADRPWAVRSLVPLGSPGSTRVMDTVGRQLESGAPSDALAPFLARAGVRFLLVRNDLDAARTGSPAPAYIRRALDGSPGIRRVTTFGPVVQNVAVSDRLLPDLGRSVIAEPPRSLEIYELSTPSDRVTTYPQEGTVGVSGGPDGLLALAGEPTFGERATTLLGDPAGAPISSAGDVLTDAVRRRDVQPGGVRDNASYPLTTTEKAPGTSDPPQDGAVLQSDDHRSVVRMTGATALSGSSYDGPLARLPERQPYAAFDGDPSTAWVSGSFVGPVKQWVQVDVAAPISPPSVTVQLLADHPWRPRPTAVTITTERGAVTWPVLPVETPQALVAPQGPTRWLRLTIADVQFPFGGAGGAGFREISVPGVDVDRTLALPAEPRPRATTAAPRHVVLQRAHADAFSNVREDEESVLRRVFTLPSAEDVRIEGTVLPVPGDALAELVGHGQPQPALVATARSTWRNIPAFGVSRMFDDDSTTAWVASADDPMPTLDLSWSGTRSVDELDLTPANGPVLRPTRIEVGGAGGSRRVDVPPDGRVRFAPLQTDHLVVTVVGSERAPAAAHVSGLVTAPAVAIAGLRIPALDALLPTPPDPTAPFHRPCGEGPSIDVDGRTVQTEVDGTLGDLLEIRPLRVTSCDGPLRLQAGEHRLSSGAPGDALVLTTADIGPTVATRKHPEPRAATVRSWAGEKRVVHMSAGAASYLALHENFNEGWTATLHGKSLDAVRLDGWRQAFAVPGGSAGDVVVSFQPASLYRRFLLLGLLLLGVMGAVALAHRRRAWTGVALDERDSAPGARRPHAPHVMSTLSVSTACAAVCVLGLVLGGVAGGLIAVGLIVAVVVARSWTWLPGVGAGAFVLAGVAAALHAGASPGSGSGPFGAPAQALALVAVLALALSLVERPRSET